MTPAYAHITRDVLGIAGPEALSYLQGQLSQDVAALAVGASAPTFVLAPQGKVDGWGRILRTGAESFEIDADPGAGAAWEARLRRFLLRTKAEISMSAEVPTVAVRGVELADAPGARPALGSGVVGTDIIGAPAGEPPAGLPADAVELAPGDLEGHRIVAGVPRWGAELDADTIPATVGKWVIDASVSFTKGCYTGQELVARIDSRGGNVPRRLVRVQVDGPVPPMGAEVLVDGKPVGTITSAADAPAGPGAVGLCFAPRSLELDEGGRAAAVGEASAHLSLLG